MVNQRLIFSASVCITLVFIGAGTVLSGPFWPGQKASVVVMLQYAFPAVHRASSTLALTVALQTPCAALLLLRKVARCASETPSFMSLTRMYRPRLCSLDAASRRWICASWQAGPRPSGSARSHAIGHEALQQYSKFNLTHLSPYFPAVPGVPAIIPGKATNLQEFVAELKPILDLQQLPARAFEWIFHHEQLLTKPHPNCGGDGRSPPQPVKRTCLAAVQPV